MGCNSSKATPEGTSGTDSRYSSGGSFKQALVILRHSERCDHVEPGYKETQDFAAWPHDTSITKAGITLARDVGLELQRENASARFSAIVCSPYRRCMQTAAEVVRLLNIPVILDQEVGETWSKDMPSDRPPHRSPTELLEMAKELGMTINNPLLPEGGVKLFGKVPTHPEVNKDCHQRCIVRIEHYIEESERTGQNFIIVTHAPAVAAMMDIFEHGFVDIEKLEYCARVIATRKLDDKRVKSELAGRKCVFASQWDVEAKGINHHMNLDAEEDKFQESLSETQKKIAERMHRNTAGDLALTEKINDLKKTPAANKL